MLSLGQTIQQPKAEAFVEEEEEGCPQFCEMDTYQISHRCPILALFRTSMRCSS